MQSPTQSSDPTPTSPVTRTAVLGGGTIGASWAALFLAAGRPVAVYDPSPTVAEDLTAYVAAAWPTLETLGLATGPMPDALTFCATPEEAVAHADFIQENVPERLEIKHDLFARIEPHLGPQAIVASSTSGLTLSQMQEGWRDPARFVLGHPFNPPHLIPLVEVMGNARTSEAAILETRAFYAAIGKQTIRLHREVPGHVANRLQAALWQEAVHLVREGVASVEDVDKAVSGGPGLRWAAMGPTATFSLGAGSAGIESFLAHLGGPLNSWARDLGQVDFSDPAIAQMLAKGLAEASDGADTATRAAQRDARIIAMQAALRAQPAD